ncbi:hypothetical protein ADL27_04600, partial [Streptomyces sp. NRRL F-6602]
MSSAARKGRTARILIPLVLLIAWLGVGGTLGPYAGKLGEVATNDQAAFLPQSAESTRVSEEQKAFSADEALPALVVWTAKDGGRLPADAREAATRTLASLADAGFTVEEVAGDAPGSRVPTVAELIAAAPPETSVVYVNTFNNPTGERYEEAALRTLVRWARDHEVRVLHDTVSSDVSASGELPFLPAVAAAEGYAAGLITVSSLSKVRAVPGFR